MFQKVLRAGWLHDPLNGGDAWPGERQVRVVHPKGERTTVESKCCRHCLQCGGWIVTLPQAGAIMQMVFPIAKGLGFISCAFPGSPL
jgi:hypothetical protein